MEAMEGVLGVDGGNTKTIAVVAGLDGGILGAARGGCGDIYAYETPELAVEQMLRAADEALQQAGMTRHNLAAACFSLAGADWPEDYDDLYAALRAKGIRRGLRVYNDAIGALRAGSPDGTGVVIACGTGIAIAARNAEGQFWHASFWVEALCGSELGREALRAVRRAALGITPPTAMTAPILAFFGVSSVEGLLRRFYLRRVNPPVGPQISRVAPIVLQAAESGDAVARGIVGQHGQRLADYALAAARQVGIEQTPFTLVLNGGIFHHDGTVLLDAILERIRQSAPGVVPVHGGYEPAIGALLLAYEEAGIAMTPQMLARLDATLPPRSLFATSGPEER